MLKRGGTARNIFVVLDGTLEVRDDDRIVNVLNAGDAFGEMAFLLERPRAFDVDAVVDGTRILSLSEGALRKMIAEDATVAAKLLFNLSKMLCVTTDQGELKPRPVRSVHDLEDCASQWRW